MYWIGVIISLLLPFVVGLLYLGILALILKWTAFKPQTIERVRAKNPPTHADAIDQMLASRQSARPWESRLDNEVQRLRRRSMGL